MRFTNCLFILLSLALFTACGSSRPGDASTGSPKRQAYYDFFNDVRAGIGAMEAEYPRLAGFTEETQTFLESREAQERYTIGGFYFERGLDRTRGAYDYADRFNENGIVITSIVFPGSEEETYDSTLKAYEGALGKQVGQNFIVYQVFTANPKNTELESRAKAIFAEQISAHAASLGAAWK